MLPLFYTVLYIIGSDILKQKNIMILISLQKMDDVTMKMRARIQERFSDIMFVTRMRKPKPLSSLRNVVGAH